MFELLAVLVSQVGDAPPASSERRIHQAELDAFSDACATPRKWLKAPPNNEVLFRPSRRAKFEQVGCLIAQMRKSNLPMNLGFVGNEAYGAEHDRN
ncbi:hypothetical protein [Sphingomonas lenta]|uniref:hypothetical protein n=1 Tax=Sphingomonas lenta TaxID=1141887 RepID=UPI001140FE36|nr:hypothetical protein [Sphingomonas lenta]